MKLSEFSEGQELHLMVLYEEQQLDFSSSIESVDSKRHFTYITPILKNNKLITFNAPGVHVNIIVRVPESKPLIYRNMILAPMKRSDDTFCYRIHSSVDGIEYNRRGAFRCSIDVNSVLKIGTEHTTYDIVIRDISVTGFSFVFSKEDFLCEPGEFVHTILNDFLEDTCEKFSFQLFATVVRCEELENHKKIFGCKIIKKVPGLETYIAKKERAAIQKNRGTGNRPLKD